MVRFRAGSAAHDQSRLSMAELEPAQRMLCCYPRTGGAIVSKVITKKERSLLEDASEMFEETGCVPGIDGKRVPAERIVPDVKKYISETIDDPEAQYDPEIWDAPGFVLVLSWLAQK
jgi:hypothetical protein